MLLKFSTMEIAPSRSPSGRINDTKYEFLRTFIDTDFVISVQHPSEAFSFPDK
jgi:hypothetical protein